MRRRRDSNRNEDATFRKIDVADGPKAPRQTKNSDQASRYGGGNEKSC